MADGSSWSIPISVLALAVSFLNYRRGGLKVAVHVACDQRPPADAAWPAEVIKVEVWNVGGRPAYISSVYVHERLWGGRVTLGLADPGGGPVIPVGGAPAVYIAPQGAWRRDLADKWWQLRVVVEGEGGRTWTSGWLTKRPSFATDSPPPLWGVVARLWNWWLRLI